MAALHHLALGGRDVRLLADFYTKSFELPFAATHLRKDGSLRSIWLRLEPGLLMIEETEQTIKEVVGIGAGLFLLAFSVPNEKRMEVEERIMSHGGTLESRSEFTSYGRDPEGNRIAISSYPLSTVQ